MPVYNESRRIRSTLEQVRAYLDARPFSSEVVVSDDGSTDDTASIVSSFFRDWPRGRLVSLPHAGKGSAVRGGMLAARGEYRFMADADLSMSIEQVDRFLPPHQRGYDIAIGSRDAPGGRRMDEPRLRRFQGRVFHLYVGLLAVRGMRDTQCGFKCFRGAVAEALFPLQHLQGFGFDVELLFLARKMGLRIIEVPVEWRYGRGSKLQPFRHSVTMAREVLQVRWNHIRGRYRGLRPPPT